MLLCLHEVLVFLKDSISIVLCLESNPWLLNFVSFYLRLNHLSKIVIWCRLPFFEHITKKVFSNFTSMHLAGSRGEACILLKFRHFVSILRWLVLCGGN
jgi:hypothetical protein